MSVGEKVLHSIGYTFDAATEAEMQPPPGRKESKMIVTTGKSIKIDVDGYLRLERSCETPGKVSVRRVDRNSGSGVQHVDLPANPEEAERFIAAYRRALAEEVPYREMRAE